MVTGNSIYPIRESVDYARKQRTVCWMVGLRGQRQTVPITRTRQDQMP